MESLSVIKWKKQLLFLSKIELHIKKYGKVIAKTKKYKVHDEENQCQIGDLVTIIETRPLSKTKRWNLKIIKQKSSRINISSIGE